MCHCACASSLYHQACAFEPVPLSLCHWSLMLFLRRSQWRMILKMMMIPSSTRWKLEMTSVVDEPNLFAAAISNRSHLSMAMGSSMTTRSVKCLRAWEHGFTCTNRRWTVLTKDIHTINDEETWMRIYIWLDGTFSQFPTWSLTLDGQERWDEFPAVLLTPGSDQWEPQATHYDDAAAAMIHNSGGIIGCESAIRWF